MATKARTGARKRRALPDLNELINRRKLRFAIGARGECLSRQAPRGKSRRRGERLGARTYTHIISPESLHARYVSVVIYLGDDRQNIHVKIITRSAANGPRKRNAPTGRGRASLTRYPV